MDDKSLTDGLGKELPYDLRQVYAVEIVGEHLKDVARSRKTDNYSVYFKCLKDLWIVIQHKIKSINKEKAKKDYEYLMNKAVKAANSHPNEFLGVSKEPIGCAEIEQAFNNIEIFLYDKVEEANLFGSSKRIPGL